MFRIFIRHISLSSGHYKFIRPPIPVFGVEGRYVQALYSAASQKNELEPVEKCLKGVKKTLKKPAVKDFLGTSMISRAAKAKLLKDVGVSVGAPNTATNFLALVAENGRLKLLNKIIRLFLEVMAAHRHEAECEVITAAPLEASEREQLLTVLKKFVKGDQKIHLTERIDHEIIGGLVVLIEDKHIDLCIYRKILLYTRLISKSV